MSERLSDLMSVEVTVVGIWKILWVVLNMVYIQYDIYEVLCRCFSPNYGGSKQTIQTLKHNKFLTYFLLCRDLLQFLKLYESDVPKGMFLRN